MPCVHKNLYIIATYPPFSFVLIRFESLVKDNLFKSSPTKFQEVNNALEGTHVNGVRASSTQLVIPKGEQACRALSEVRRQRVVTNYDRRANVLNCPAVREDFPWRGTYRGWGGAPPGGPFWGFLGGGGGWGGPPPGGGQKWGFLGVRGGGVFWGQKKVKKRPGHALTQFERRELAL